MNTLPTICAFVTPRADAISRLSKDLVAVDDPRHALIQSAAADMEKFERFLQSCFLDRRCECDEYGAEPPLGPKCRACTARTLYYDGLKVTPPTAYVKEIK